MLRCTHFRVPFPTAARSLVALGGRPPRWPARPPAARRKTQNERARRICSLPLLLLAAIVAAAYNEAMKLESPADATFIFVLLMRLAW